ncbi:mannosyl-oligosaccharide 1,2-alpha-mannosidase [Saccharomycopsis crataegensis]|uniref:alpha-1,2-Mannosidase n=1 Tax=Saccharomycopsis crataegensis TaxID=43959 RepID=A0AAV5QMZ9_9ASCO|nr:mannosyl-oligosaccharide 1,2-alpha-mannosidase [Saccharomycopsis crataegensis]
MPTIDPWKPSSKPGLPTHYREKPKLNEYGSLGSSRNQKWWLFPKKKLGKLLSLLVILYLGYSWFTKSPSSASSSSSFINTPQANVARQNKVKQVFVESFDDYADHAWGTDVYKTISKTGKNMGPKPLGWMIVDSLDTLYLMGLKPQIKKSRKWVDEVLDYDMDYEVNTFETTIRMLGGLLSAYHLSNNDKLYLDKAIDLADRLLGAFDSATGLPYSSVNLHTGQGIPSMIDAGASSTAEVATLQLEFKYLAQLTGNPVYWEKVEKVIEVLYNVNQPTDGLVPIFIQPDTGKFRGNLLRLGSRGDSYYEYLLKQHLQTGERIYAQLYRESVNGVKKHMVRKSGPSGLSYIGELEHGINGQFSSKMDHLVCFYGGLLALGATDGETVEDYRRHHLWTSTRNDDLQLGKEITKACYMMYHQTETGLAPEIVVFNDDPAANGDFYIKRNDRHNLQRPETVESLFILYRITKDPIYRQWGWEIFENFVKYTKVPIGGKGYDSINDVTNPDNVGFRNNMESFWLAETLKYLYLLFEEDFNVTPLNKVVFNTEAHPLPMFSPKFATGWKLEKNLGNDFGVEQTVNFAGRNRGNDRDSQGRLKEEDDGM